MDDKTIKQNDEIEIDLQRLFRALANKAWLISIVAVVCAVVVLLGTVFFVTPKYQSTAMFYVNNNSVPSIAEDMLSSITSADINASRGLVKTYIVILNTRESLNDVIDYAGADLTYQQLRGMISAESVDATEVFRVVVTSDDPVEAERLANAIAYILPNRIKDIIDGTSAKVVESAVVASAPSSPSYTRNTLLGFVVGLLAAAVIVVALELMDVTIRTEEDIAQSCRHPVLAAVPDMNAHTKGGYYGYGEKKRKKKSGSKLAAAENQKDLVGGSISFAAAESYKLLRTKLQFSFADEANCRVIGVSSALIGEGKSLSAVNLAYTMSQLGKRVLLVDCDMRRPSVHEKLPINKNPGLSDFLSGQSSADNLIQLCGLKDDERAFHIIAAGRTPPNPMELLSSARMEKMLTRLRDSYDYIILDLPPVGEVSDALAVAKLTDGMLLVVRQNYCDRLALNAAVRQFEFIDSRILGVIINCTVENGAGYGGKLYSRYYKKYYNRYYKNHGYGSYAPVDRVSSDK